MKLGRFCKHENKVRKDCGYKCSKCGKLFPKYPEVDKPKVKFVK